jgi:hypothetical protein
MNGNRLRAGRSPPWSCCSIRRGASYNLPIMLAEPTSSCRRSSGSCVRLSVRRAETARTASPISASGDWWMISWALDRVSHALGSAASQFPSAPAQSVDPKVGTLRASVPSPTPKSARATFKSSDVVGVGCTFSGPVSCAAAVRPAWLAAFVVPQSLACAGLAGSPPQTGLAGYLLAGLGYALLR